MLRDSDGATQRLLLGWVMNVVTTYTPHSTLQPDIMYVTCDNKAREDFGGKTLPILTVSRNIIPIIFLIRKMFIDFWSAEQQSLIRGLPSHLTVPAAGFFCCSSDTFAGHCAGCSLVPQID